MATPADPGSLRVVNVVATLDPRAGGVPAAVLQLGESIGRVVRQSTIVTLDPPDSVWLRDADVPTVALGRGRLKYRYNPHVRDWLAANATSFDAVIAHGIWEYGALAARRASRDAGLPYFVFTHGMLDPWFKRAYPLKHAKKWVYWPWGTYRILRDATAVFFTSEEERRLARESFCLYRAREAVVKLGLARPPGGPESQAAAFYEGYDQLRGKRILLFLSRLHRKKGCDLLIRAFADAARLDPDLHLVVAGPDEGEERSKLEALTMERGLDARVTFTGMLSGDVKWGAYRVADAFVLTSHAENYGLVVVEALACGLPVLITDKVNIWREIAEARAGLVEADTLEGAERLLERWLRLTPNERQRMGRQALLCYERQFELDAAARATADTMCRYMG